MISSRAIENVCREVMISEMVGRKMEQIYPKTNKRIGEILFETKNLSRQGVFEKISFQLHRGEILGFAGMVGAGRTEIVSSIFGITPCSGGQILLNGEAIHIRSPRDALRYRLALIPEDRARDGLNLIGDIRSNICMTVIDKLSYLKGIVPDRRLEKKRAEQMIADMQIRCTGEKQIVHSLSGGNQQKIVVGKWLLTEPQVIFLDEPTRGIDVGAKYEIYQLIQKLASEGKGVLVISSEMPELLGICDRIIVLKEGRICGEFATAEATQERIMETIVRE